MSPFAAWAQPKNSTALSLGVHDSSADSLLQWYVTERPSGWQGPERKKANGSVDAHALVLFMSFMYKDKYLS